MFQPQEAAAHAATPNFAPSQQAHSTEGTNQQSQHMILMHVQRYKRQTNKETEYA